MPVRLFQPTDWWAWRSSRPPHSVGGSELYDEVLGLVSFAGDGPDEATARAGHELEPLILARLHAYLLAIGEDVPPFESGWVAQDEEHPYRTGSFDGLARRDGRPVLAGEGKAVFLGQQRRLWRPNTPQCRADGLARHVEAQAVWYCDLLRCPVWVAALFLPDYDLGGMPAAAAVPLGALHVWCIRPEETVDAREALRTAAELWRERQLAGDAIARTGQAFGVADEPRYLAGGYPDAVLLARYSAARVEEEAQREVARAATRLARAAAEEAAELKEEIRARVGDQRGIVAGGRIATVTKSGSVLVRETNRETS